jgi:hypothetical protein
MAQPVVKMDAAIRNFARNATATATAQVAAAESMRNAVTGNAMTQEPRSVVGILGMVIYVISTRPVVKAHVVTLCSVKIVISLPDAAKADVTRKIARPVMAPATAKFATTTRTNDAVMANVMTLGLINVVKIFPLAIYVILTTPAATEIAVTQISVRDVWMVHVKMDVAPSQHMYLMKPVAPVMAIAIGPGRYISSVCVLEKKIVTVIVTAKILL